MPAGNVATAIPANRSGQPEVLRQRVLTAIVALAVIAIVIFVLPELYARLFVAALFIAAAWEWAGFLFADNNARKLFYVGFIVILIGLFFAVLPDAALLSTILKAAVAWWAIALLWLFMYPTKITPAVSWVCGALVMVPAWLALDFLYRHDPGMLMYVLLIVWIADIGAFFVGKMFGRVKLAPSISPGKTWEGVFGGLVAVSLLALAGSAFVPAGMAILVPFSIAVAMLSVVGDLTVSMFKRSAGVKDSGSLFPGHGGVLDRIDSVCAAAPLFALALGWIGLY